MLVMTSLHFGSYTNATFYFTRIPSLQHGVVDLSPTRALPTFRVEVRVYVQKVKHLEYEHQNNLKAIAMDGDHLLDDESGLHG